MDEIGSEGVLLPDTGGGKHPPRVGMGAARLLSVQEEKIGSLFLGITGGVGH